MRDVPPLTGWPTSDGRWDRGDAEPRRQPAGRIDGPADLGDRLLGNGRCYSEFIVYPRPDNVDLVTTPRLSRSQSRSSNYRISDTGTVEIVVEIFKSP